MTPRIFFTLLGTRHSGDYDSNEITILDLYARVTTLTDVRVLLGLGGWTDSAGDKYSRLVSSPSNRRAFISQLVKFLKLHNFNGLHLDWNYPKCWQSNCAKGPASDKNDFSALIKVIRALFVLIFSDKNVIAFYFQIKKMYVK
jgi:GH18 family chitinase